MAEEYIDQSRRELLFWRESDCKMGLWRIKLVIITKENTNRKTKTQDQLLEEKKTKQTAQKTKDGMTKAV